MLIYFVLLLLIFISNQIVSCSSEAESVKCDADDQFSINIISNETIYDGDLPKIKFLNYEKLIYWNLTRNNNSGKKFLRYLEVNL